MSSSTYSSELRPDARSRGIVLVSALVLLAAGVVLAAALPIPGPVGALVVVAWTALAGWQAAASLVGVRRVRRLRLYAGGRMEILIGDRWLPATLLPGSVILERLAWIRFRSDDGRVGAELLTTARPRERQWRRLLVIWRHIGAPE